MVVIIVKKNKYKVVWKCFWKNFLIIDYLFICYVVIIKILVNVGMGILDMIGDKSNIDNNKKIVWKIFVKCVCVLDLIIMFVWVIVVVVGMLLKNGKIKLLIFCVISFWLLFNGFFVMWLVEVL